MSKKWFVPLSIPWLLLFDVFYKILSRFGKMQLYHDRSFPFGLLAYGGSWIVVVDCWFSTLRLWNGIQSVIEW